MHVEGLDLREVIIFLAAAGLIVPVVHRMKLSPALGFLVVGLLIGPHGLARFSAAAPWLRHVVITDLGGVRPFAELGIVSLLFMIGLDLSAERLWSMRKLVFGLGSFQVTVTSAVIAAIAYGLGNSPSASLVLGSSLALSSTAIVVQLLSERRRLDAAVGRSSFAVLLFQDLAVVPILFMVGVLGTTAEGSIGAAFGLALLQAAAAIALILGVGWAVIRPLFRFVGATHSRELFMAAVLLAIIGAATAAAAAGLSMALGAFLAGLLFAETEYHRQIEVDVEPFKGLLLGVFFMSVGMATDLSLIVARPLWILACVLGLFAIKAAILAASARTFRLPPAQAVEMGLLLGQAGEFAFVIGGLAVTLGLLPAESGQVLQIVAGTTMMMTPLVARRAEKLAASIERHFAGAAKPELPAGPDDMGGHVIIVGYGRVGKLVGEMLARHGIACLAIDDDPYLVDRERKLNKSVYFGDATRYEFLRRCGIAKARALVATMDSPRGVEWTVAAARGERSDMTIVARARDAQHAVELYRLGATDAVPETIEASLQLSEALLVDIGVPMGLVIASIHEKRDEFRAVLSAEDAAGRERRSIRARSNEGKPN